MHIVIKKGTVTVKNEKLIQARQRLGLTQQETAKEAKVSLRAYQNYENEGQTPNARTAIRIADALASTVENLFRDDTPL